MTATAVERPAAAEPHVRLVNGLIDTLHSERRLLDETNAIMVRQRAAIASDDLEALDDSVFALQRLLLTLGEARTRRRTLLARLGCDEETAPRHLCDALGSQCTETLRQAGAELEASAYALSREVAVNRDVLQQGLTVGDEFFRCLAAGAAPPAAGYPDVNERGQAQGARLLNRQA